MMTKMLFLERTYHLALYTNAKFFLDPWKICQKRDRKRKKRKFCGLYDNALGNVILGIHRLLVTGTHSSDPSDRLVT